MIRIVLFLISVLVVAWGFAWVADRPGEIAITWMGYRVETSVIVAAFAVAALVLIILMIWSIVRAILRSPEQVSLFFRHRRAIKGYLAISRGLIAVGAGDLRLARRSADDAARLSPGDPLALLLTAQSAQMAGDSVTAERAFRESLDSLLPLVAGQSRRAPKTHATGLGTDTAVAGTSNDQCALKLRKTA